MKVTGLPEYLKNIKLAYFSYFATCEGKTIEAKIVTNRFDIQKQIEGLGFTDPKLIDCVIEKELFNQKYLDWNPDFKAKFYECFGFEMWEAFLNCVADNDGFLDLHVKMHYNLS